MECDDPVHRLSCEVAAHLVNLYFQVDRGESKAILFQRLQHLLRGAMEDATRERLHKLVTSFSVN